MKIIEYKGICCYFSDALVKTLLTETELIHLLDHFFEYNPVETIEWVSLKHTKTSDDVKFPMYTVSNGEITVLFWPIQEDPRKLRSQSSRANRLLIELLSETKGLTDLVL